MKTIKVLLYQQKLLGQIPDNDYGIIQSYKPDFICLPEYFFHPDFISYKDSINYMKKISKDLNTVLIGGTTVLKEADRLYNCCYVFDKGKVIGHYRKVHLFERENGRITPGKDFKVFVIEGVRLGILICADVLYKKSWKLLAALKPDIIFIPTFSPYKEESQEIKFKRDYNIFVTGAIRTSCPVVKVCSIGELHNHRVQGRSLLANPNNIVWRVSPQDENTKIIKCLDINLNDFYG